VWSTRCVSDTRAVGASWWGACMAGLGNPDRSPPSPTLMVSPSLGASRVGLYGVSARCRLGERAPSPAPFLVVPLARWPPDRQAGKLLVAPLALVRGPLHRDPSQIPIATMRILALARGPAPTLVHVHHAAPSP
jgi:hypothetical protein